MDLVAAHAAKQPHRPALIEGGRSLTWEQFFRMRNRLAHSLAALGIGVGQHVIVYAHNALENLVAGAALRALGAIGVPMNHRLTAEEVAYILDDSDATAVFVGDAFLPMAERVRGAARVKRWITLGPERRPWAEALDDLLARGSEAPPPAVPAMGGSMIYTAGTTGKPKGARRRVTDPAAILPRLAALDCLDPAQVHLVAGPLYHSAPGGFALYAQMVGGTVVVMRKFDPEEALRLVERHHCTTTFMAPTLLKRIVDLPAEVRARYDVSSMRSLVIAAAPCPMRVKEQAVAMFGPALYEFYGSTELGVNTVLRPEDVLRKPGSCGRGVRGAGRRVGRAPARRHPAWSRRARHRARADGLLPRPPRRLQGAARGVLPRRLPARHRGHARQAAAARALLGRPNHARLIVTEGGRHATRDPCQHRQPAGAARGAGAPRRGRRRHHSLPPRARAHRRRGAAEPRARRARPGRGDASTRRLRSGRRDGTGSARRLARPGARVAAAGRWRG